MLGREVKDPVEKSVVLGKLGTELTNEYRESLGLSAQEWSDDLHALCYEHSYNMATGAVDFGHDGQDDRFDAADNAFAPDGISWFGENVAQNSETPL